MTEGHAAAEISAAAAYKLLTARADVLADCAAEIQRDEPGIARVWMEEAEETRQLAGESVNGRIPPEVAVKILKIQAQALEECALEIQLDYPQLYRKWMKDVRDWRQMAGEDPEE